MLVSPPVLILPDFSKPFILDTDTSDFGIRAVLSQANDDGHERVLAYASRTLSKAERNYSVACKELLAMVTFISHFRQYLLGHTFTLHTDHSSLTWLRNSKQPEGQLARWLEKLGEFSFTVQHHPGQKHKNADSLSPLNTPLHINAATSSATVFWGMTASEITTLQLKDKMISPVLTAKESEQRPSNDTLSKYTFKTRKCFQLWDQKFVDNGILLQLFLNTDTHQTYKQLIVPKCLQAKILDQLHSGVVSGHLGKAKVLGKLKSWYYWPGHY